ncbi:MAG: T9SS type A sorting domain-containing protein [Ignavibacteriaceae bacterium]
MKNKVIFIFVFFFCSNIHPQLMRWTYLIDENFYQMEISTSGDIYATSFLNSKVYKSTNDGTNWSQIFQIHDPTSLTVKGKDTIFVGTLSGELYISTDAGASFKLLKNFPSAIWSIKSRDFSGINCTIVGTDSSGIFTSIDNCVSWKGELTKIKYFWQIAVSKNNILVRTIYNGLYLSQDFGLTWNKKNVKADTEWIDDIETVEGDSTVFALTGGVYKSTNSGGTWELLSNINVGGNDLAYSPMEKQLFAGAYVSDDQGVSWRKICTFRPDLILIKDSTTFLLTETGSLYREDHTPPYIYGGNNFLPLAVGNKWQYIKTNSGYNGISYSTSYNLSTIEVLSDTILNGKHCFLVNDDGTYNFLYYSDDNKLFLEFSGIEKLLMDFNLLGHDEFEYYGATWATVYEGPVSLFGYERYSKGLSSDYYGVPFTRKYADSIGVYYYHSNDDGPMGSYYEKRLDLIEALVKIKDSTFLYKVNYFSSVDSNTINLLSDTLLGINVTVSHPRDIITDIPQKNLFYTNSVEIEYFFVKGTDSIGGGKKYLNRLENSNSFSDSIYFSSSLYNQGYEIKYRFHLTDKGIIPSPSTYPGNGFLSYKIDPVNIDKENPQIQNFQLAQNYPNPFNPSTRIEYSVASSQNVTLKVFDILGNEVATLVNELKVPGVYTVQFDGGNLTSGVYFYKLQSGSFVQSKKFILMK